MRLWYCSRDYTRFLKTLLYVVDESQWTEVRLAGLELASSLLRQPRRSPDYAKHLVVNVVFAACSFSNMARTLLTVKSAFTRSPAAC